MKFNWPKIILVLLLIALAAVSVLLLNKYLNEANLNVTIPPAYKMDQPSKPVETTLFFAGDIMLSRNVGTKIFQANDPTLPFQNLQGIIKNANISFANLESPFNDRGPRVTQGLVFKAEPNTVEGLTYAGFDVLSTANNHTYDQGKNGLNYTLTLLKQNGIIPVGTGADCHDGVIKEANGIKFGFLAYSYSAYNDAGRVPDPLVCDWNDQGQMVTDIKNLRSKVDFLIVSSHLGAEYNREPEPENAKKARTLIDAGADLFIGHHPHWVQTIEQYNGKYLFYSLGNFVFDQMWSQDTKEGLAVTMTFENKEISKIELLPVIIENYCCPRVANDVETKSILDKIKQDSVILFQKN